MNWFSMWVSSCLLTYRWADRDHFNSHLASSTHAELVRFFVFSELTHLPKLGRAPDEHIRQDHQLHIELRWQNFQGENDLLLLAFGFGLLHFGWFLDSGWSPRRNASAHSHLERVEHLFSLRFPGCQDHRDSQVRQREELTYRQQRSKGVSGHCSSPCSSGTIEITSSRPLLIP